MAALAASEETRSAELKAVTAELAALRETAQAQQAQVQALHARLEEQAAQHREALAALAEARDQALGETAGLRQRLGQAQASASALQAEVARVAQAEQRPSPFKRDDVPPAASPEEPGLVEAPGGLATGQAVPESVRAIAQAPSSTTKGATSVEAAEADVRIARVEVETPTDPAPAAGTQDGAPPTAQIEAFVRDWATAWARQDVDGYLFHYAADFEPADGASRTAWAELRRRRLLRPKRINAEVSGLETALLEGHEARVTFEQAYRADHYQDRVEKTLVLRLEGDDWKILREESHPLRATPTTPG